MPPAPNKHGFIGMLSPQSPVDELMPSWPASNTSTLCTLLMNKHRVRAAGLQKLCFAHALITTAVKPICRAGSSPCSMFHDEKSRAGRQSSHLASYRMEKEVLYYHIQKLCRSKFSNFSFCQATVPQSDIPVSTGEKKKKKSKIIKNPQAKQQYKLSLGRALAQKITSPELARTLTQAQTSYLHLMQKAG